VSRGRRTPGVGSATSLNCARGSSDERWICGLRVGEKWVAKNR
jgi:hypothetical protein